MITDYMLMEQLAVRNQQMITGYVSMEKLAARNQQMITGYMSMEYQANSSWLLQGTHSQSLYINLFNLLACSLQ